MLVVYFLGQVSRFPEQLQRRASAFKNSFNYHHNIHNKYETQFTGVEKDIIECNENFNYKTYDDRRTSTNASFFLFPVK